MMSHGNLASNALTLHSYWGWQPDDVLLHALPIFHAHGLFVATNCVLLNGSAMLFLPKFDVEQVFRLLPRATVFMGVPTFYARLLADPRLNREACRHMRLFISGSAPLLAETHREFEARTGHAILERYGMTETVMLTSNPLDGDRIPGTVGYPLPGVEVRVTDPETGPRPGRRTKSAGSRSKAPTSSPATGACPRRPPPSSAPTASSSPAMSARSTSSGYVHIVGRAKDLVICGGYNVYPKEVETVIDAIDGVAESAVVGVPHPDFGEAVVAVVLRRPGSTDVAESRK